MADDIPHRTLEEVAAQYRFSERKLRELIKKHNLPVLQSGKRLIRFDRLALNALEEALRRPCLIGSPPEKTATERSQSRGRTRSPAAALDSARKAITDALQRKRPGSSRRNISGKNTSGEVIPIRRSRKQSRST